MEAENCVVCWSIALPEVVPYGLLGAERLGNTTGQNISKFGDNRRKIESARCVPNSKSSVVSKPELGASFFVEKSVFGA